MDSWFVYIARAETGHLYTGISKDVKKRVNLHNSGQGAKFTRMHRNLKLVYVSPPIRNRSEASKRESQIKKWTRAKKEKLISIWKIQN